MLTTRQHLFLMEGQDEQQSVMPETDLPARSGRLACWLMVDVEPLRRFLRSHFRLSKKVSLADDEPLLPDVIDSFGVIEVADFVEETYDITFSREDLIAYAENFGSLSAIGALIERKVSEKK